MQLIQKIKNIWFIYKNLDEVTKKVNYLNDIIPLLKQYIEMFEINEKLLMNNCVFKIFNKKNGFALEFNDKNNMYKDIIVEPSLKKLLFKVAKDFNIEDEDYQAKVLMEDMIEFDSMGNIKK